MSGIDGVVRVEEASALLGVSVRRVEQLAVSGDLTRAAHGLIDLASVHHYLAARAGSTSRRAWSEVTAWAALGLLSGVDVDWLGVAQRSRLRGILRETDAADLTRRARNRARVLRYSGHASAGARLREDLVVAGHDGLGLVTVGERSGVDGYVAAHDLDRLVERYALRTDAAGGYVLRATTFDLDTIAAIAAADQTLLAIDAATSLDPRERAQGHEILTARLAGFRG
jgi:hypothetical protein